MNIIDAHIHTNFQYQKTASFTQQNNIDFSWEGLQKEMNENNIVGVLAITTDLLAPTPGESEMLFQQAAKDSRIFPVCSIHPSFVTKKHLSLTEKLLKEKMIYGIKIFPGYNPVYPSDKRYFPFYKLAGKYHVPVIIHTGDTFGSNYFVKYAHPLDVDEIAVRFPETTFVIAHLGNPWVRDATEVVYKNENVYADISAFCIGHDHQKAPNYVMQDIRYALEYTNRPDKFIYGSDWPLTSMRGYISIMKEAVPTEYHHQIFFENANSVFKLGLK